MLTEAVAIYQVEQNICYRMSGEPGRPQIAVASTLQKTRAVTKLMSLREAFDMFLLTKHHFAERERIVKQGHASFFKLDFMVDKSRRMLLDKHTIVPSHRLTDERCDDVAQGRASAFGP